jgi:hypothetical protein
MNSMASHVYFGEKANNRCKIKSHKGREREKWVWTYGH